MFLRCSLQLLSRLMSRLLSRAKDIFSLHNNTERISMKFAGSDHYYKQIELLAYILSKIGTGIREQDIRNIRIDVNRFCHDVKQLLTPYLGLLNNTFQQPT